MDDRKEGGKNGNNKKINLFFMGKELFYHFLGM